MKLYKALKLKKKLTGEIAALKDQIKSKNSYLVNSKNAEKFVVADLYKELLSKIETLTNLKFAINEANHEIQSKIYMLAEYKALVAFWKEVPVLEGDHTSGYSETIKTYNVQIDEKERNKLIEEYQLKIDAIQEDIDTHNYTTDILWDEKPIEE